MQMAIDVAGFTARRGRPAAPGHGLQAQPPAHGAAPPAALRRHGRAGHHRRRSPTRSSRRWRPSPTTASPRATRCRSPTWCTRRPWIKLYEPAAFCAALLNAQPMGFYSPQSLVQDARRHGVVVRTPDLNASDWRADARTVRSAPTGGAGGAARAVVGALARRRPGQGGRRRPSLRRPGGPRAPGARARRSAHLEAMATAGAFGCFGLDRREALWSVGAVAQSRPGRLQGIVTGADAPTLPGMSDQEVAVADLWATGVAPDGHPTRFVREPVSTAQGVVPAVGAAGPRRRQPGGGGRRGHPPPATGHGPGHHVHQPRGRDRPHQRGVLEGCWARYRRVAGARRRCSSGGGWRRPRGW